MFSSFYRKNIHFLVNDFKNVTFQSDTSVSTYLGNVGADVWPATITSVTVNDAEAADSIAVVDAIDTIAPKCALIGEALRRGIPIVSSMGAGAKSDITQIRFADLWDTYHCGLAKAVRTRLKKAAESYM